MSVEFRCEIMVTFEFSCSVFSVLTCGYDWSDIGDMDVFAPNIMQPCDQPVMGHGQVDRKTLVK